MASDATTPTKIKKLSPGEIQILWADGHETRHLAPLLRGLCPCASCQDEMTGQRVVLPIHIPDTLEFRKIELVGLCRPLRVQRPSRDGYLQLRISP
jgi:DUF971 family protein